MIYTYKKMMVGTMRLSASQKTKEFYSKYNTGRTNDIIKDEQAKIDNAIASGEKINDSYFLLLAAKISEKNVNKDGTGRLDFDNIEGGPFAAVIVRYDSKNIERPVIVGIGANHVVPENDPSAHGEMSAIRDAAHRTGSSDLSGTVMFTSCECCPQCQASISGVGIGKVVFANDRNQAAGVGFSDEQQYRYMADIFNNMTRIDHASIQTRKDDLISKLGDNEAVILDMDDNVFAVGNTDLASTDPTDSLASMVAIRTACRKSGSFHLPDEFSLLTKNIVHPAAFTTADWARIGRVRHAEHKEDTEKDQFEKNPTKIIFVNPEFEEMRVVGKDGQAIVL